MSLKWEEKIVISVHTVSGQLPPEENCPPVSIGVWVKIRVSFRVGRQPDNCPAGKLPSG